MTGTLRHMFCIDWYIKAHFLNDWYIKAHFLYVILILIPSYSKLNH